MVLAVTATGGLPPPKVREQTDPLTILESMITRRLGSRVRDLSLELDDQNQLIIRGHSKTYHAKQLAQHAVMEVSDYIIAANEIVVI